MNAGPGPCESVVTSANGTYQVTPADVARFAQCLHIPWQQGDPAPLGYAYLPAFRALYRAARQTPGCIAVGSVHAGHEITWHARPSPPYDVTTNAVVDQVREIATGRLITVTGISTTADGTVLCEQTMTMLARPEVQRPTVSAAAPSDPPTQPPLWRAVPLDGDLARRYDLASGDHSPIHTDPEAARAAGFAGPILQGSCTFALAAATVQELLETHADASMSRLSLRFRAPVAPAGVLIVGLSPSTGDGYDVTVMHHAAPDSRGLLVADGRVTAEPGPRG